MTDIMYPLPGPFISPLRLRLELARFTIAGIAMRILVRVGGYARALLAAQVLAILTLLGAFDKIHSTSMAGAMDSLANRFPDEVRPARARGQRQRRQRVARVSQVRREA